MYEDERGRRQGGERVAEGVVVDVGAVAVDDVVTDVAEAVVVLLAAEAVARE